MDNNDLLSLFDCERQCEYKGRRYLVRDNGSILRLPKDGQRRSKYDNVWTFGTKKQDGYMILTGNIRVHQVVCTAFNGPEPEPNMVVDHVDTNRCNNRPENLRWLTRLENALFNEATRKKIIFLCGSIEAFIENPAIIRDKALSPDISWMKTVTKEQAATCKKHIEEWSKLDSNPNPNSKGIGDWIFVRFDNELENSWNEKRRINRNYKSDYQNQVKQIEEMNLRIYEKEYGLKDSLTPGAKQFNWKTPTEFLLCPQGETPRTLQTYLCNLVRGELFIRNRYGGGKVVDADYNIREDALYVLTEDISSVKPWGLTKITMERELFVHTCERTCFSKDGGLKYFTLAMGREWTGGEVFDDFC